MNTTAQPAAANPGDGELLAAGAGRQPRRIARVLPLVGVPHLDRLFDYEVPAEVDADAQAGVRVRIRFNGRLVDGFIIERRSSSDHSGKLRPLERVISPIRLLPEHMWRLVNQLAERAAGTRADVLRAAIPPRHASAEKAGLFAGGKAWEDLYSTLEPVAELRAQARSDAESALGKYRFGPRFLAALLDEGAAPRMSLLTAPGDDDARLAAVLAAATAWAGKSALVIAPNQRLVDRVSEALTAWTSTEQVLQMTAAESSHVRYRRFLSIVLGQARIVVGTRNAVFAPLKDLGLVLVLGEGDDSLVDPRAPYLHAREVAKARSQGESAALAIIGHHRTAEVQQWVAAGELASIRPTPETLREQLPWIRGLGDTERQLEAESHSPGSRLPALAFATIRETLDADGTVLVQVPRRGYAPALACARCRTPARCRNCNGPLELPQANDRSAPTCRWCGHLHPTFTCTNCGNHALRMSVVGHDRTAEELGRAFPGVPVTVSGGEQVKASVPPGRRIVVATPGSEPILRAAGTPPQQPNGHYGALIVLDPWAPLTRADLRAEENALRQWMGAAALVAPREAGGRVIVAGDYRLSAIQQLIRWNPDAAAAAELASRVEAKFPPAAVVAVVDGTPASLAELEESWELPESAELLGPVELPTGVRLPAGLSSGHADEARRLIIRVPHSDALSLGSALKSAVAVRSSQRHSAPLRVVMDPVRIG